MIRYGQEERDNGFIPWQALRDRTVFITGATGLIGRALTDTLLYGGARVLALVRDAERARRQLGRNAARVGLLEGSVEQLPAIPGRVDYIIHCACPTGSAFFVTHPVETIDAIVAGTRAALELAREKQVRGMVYLSSMEVYGQVLTRQPLPEDALGRIDLMSARSSYPEGKRLAECLCRAYAEEYRVPVRIARLAQTFGPGVEPEDGRVFAYMARCALRGEDIVLQTDGSKENAYLYTGDAVSAILGLLEKGEAGEVYNVANEDTYCSVREMAEQVAQVIGQGRISVRTGTDSGGGLYPPAGYLNLSTARLRALGWRPETGLMQMYTRMIEGFGERETAE